MLYDKRWDAKVETKLEPWRQHLLDAADILERVGHCKGELTDSRGRHCALGALGVAIGSKDLRWNGDAVSALRRHLGTDMISLWNNAPERTAAEVIATMREVARS